MSRRSVFGVAAALLLLAAAPGFAQVDRFSSDLERDALSASARGELVEAAHLYRVACFGMLDDPARLAACTVRLATAQAAAKDREGFRASFTRLATAEERYQGLTRAGLPEDELRAFAHLATTQLTAEQLATIPPLAAIVSAEKAAAEAAIAEAKPKPKSRKQRERPPEEAPAPVVEPPDESNRALTEGATSSTAPETSPAPSGEERPSAEAASDSAVASSEAGPATSEAAPAPEESSSAAMPPQATPEPMPEPTADTEDRARLELARQRLTEHPDRSVVAAELEAVRPIADRLPADASASRLAGDLAYLLGEWPVCAEYYQRAGDPGAEQPLGRFYMAVCLYEIGQKELAARVIRPSADRLKPSPFVKSYLDRILDRSGSS